MAKAQNPKPKKSTDGAAVSKAIALIQAFVDGQDAWGVRELANALGQPSSSAHRLLQLFARHNMVEWVPETQKYKSGIELFRWSAILSKRFKLADVAKPVMASLAAEIEESCWLGIYEPTRHLHAYLSEVVTERALSYSAKLAQYEPLSNSAGGLAILASLNSPERLHSELPGRGNKGLAPQHVQNLQKELHHARSCGFATVVLNGDEGPVLIAAPIFSAAGAPVGSLTVAVPPYRAVGERRPTIGRAVVAAAERLSRLIGSQVIGAATTGSWNKGLNAIANVMQREVGIGKTITSVGGEGALRSLQAGEGAYCFAVAASLDAAYRGLPPFSKPHTNLRAICSLLPLHLHIVARRDCPASEFNELRDLRISAGERDYSTVELVVDLLIRSGLAKTRTTATRQLIFLDPAEAHRELKQGKLDVVISLTGVGDPSFLTLAESFNIKLLKLDDDLVSGLISQNPTYQRVTIPARTYVGQNSPVDTIKVPTILVTTAERGYDEVYSVTRTISNNWSELSSAIPQAGPIAADVIFQGVTIPLHPAARGFWTEQGLIAGQKRHRR
jgi:TRAP transporter TAXI family solute receptor